MKSRDYAGETRREADWEDAQLGRSLAFFRSSSMWQSEFFSAEVGNCSSWGAGLPTLSLCGDAFAGCRTSGRPPPSSPNEAKAPPSRRNKPPSVCCSLNLCDMLTFGTCVFKRERDKTTPNSETSKPTGMNCGRVAFILQPEVFNSSESLYYMDFKINKTAFFLISG